MDCIRVEKLYILLLFVIAVPSESMLPNTFSNLNYPKVRI